MIKAYTQIQQAQAWLQRYRGCCPLFACVLGFTETALIPGISTAGATPDDRRYTAIADAEFLYRGARERAVYPLPPLDVGISPAFITRAVLEGQQIPLFLFNAGLPRPPAVPTIHLGGQPARCLTTGAALSLETVEHLLQQGLAWGAQWGSGLGDRYLVVGECVVGGTSTALAILTGLGIDAHHRVNSSHPTCNHSQKWELVQQGLRQAGLESSQLQQDPLALVAAVGDPMQVFVAGLTIAASCHRGVLLAGGTQMLAVYALARAIAQSRQLPWQPDQVMVGTTRWVAEDPTADTVGLAEQIGQVSLLASQLSFAQTRYPQLLVYERGYVKEGVGAGGSAIAASLYQGWGESEILEKIEQLVEHYNKHQTD